jgi:hypothetical protein
MAGPCTPAFAHLARELGGQFSCSSGNPLVRIRAPWELTNWTLPVVEVLMVGGAIYALVHALRRRRAGDPTVLSLWFASIVYLLIIEPPLYFPDQIGFLGLHQIVFAHNVFTVDFLWDRLPLYIVALYPALITLSFEIVRSLGVFERRGVIVGSICVGFVHHCFYEVFDQLGPQLRWWAWNPLADSTHPRIAAVPMSSMVLFAAVAPAVLTLTVQWVVGQPARRGKTIGGWNLAGRTIGAGGLMLIGLSIAGIPSRIFMTHDPNGAGQITAYLVELAIFPLVGILVLVSCWHRSRRHGPTIDEETRTYAQWHGFAYLAVFAVLWVTALPDYLKAVHSITPSGTPVGSVAYAAACLAACLALVAAVRTAGVRGGPIEPEAIVASPSRERRSTPPAA